MGVFLEVVEKQTHFLRLQGLLLVEIIPAHQGMPDQFEAVPIDLVHDFDYSIDIVLHDELAFLIFSALVLHKQLNVVEESFAVNLALNTRRVDRSPHHHQ